jgi:phosphate transport system ATP-binding protein
MDISVNQSGERIQQAYTSAEPSAVPKLRLGAATAQMRTDADIKIAVHQAHFWYGQKQVLFNVSMLIRERQVTALIGPSGCGKSTFLRTLNRMNDLIPHTRTEGEALLDGENIFGNDVDVVALRKRVGMVFQRPNPFPKSIYENVAYGLHIQGKSRKYIRERVEESLRGAALWDEVKDRLKA